MRIGVNCLNIQPGFVGGVNTFTTGMLRGFAKQGKGHAFHLFVTSRNEYLFREFSNLPSFSILVLDDKSRRFRDALSRTALLAGSERAYELASNMIHRKVREVVESETDVVYTPSTVFRYFDQRKPSVLSMHDIQHIHFPHFFSWARRLSRRITYSLSAKRAIFLQASSDFMRRDLLGHFHNLKEDQVRVIPEGVNIERFSDESNADSVRRMYALPERFLFYPAQMWHHKNHITLLRALKFVEKQYGERIPLVLTGARFDAAPAIFRFLSRECMDYVRYLGRVSFDHLVALYQSASLLVMPSLYESSSLPVLEAAAAGLPIVASDIPPCREFAETLQLSLFPPTDVAALATLIASVWNEPSALSKQVSYNRRRINAYSWENAATKLLDLCIAAA